MPPPIFKLPDELLLDIANYVDQQKRLQYYELDRDMSILPIINFSMTCRRFREVSADLLVNTATVEMTKSSLERFEEITGHPSIRKGVRNIVISLRFFSQELCEDFEKFMKFYAEELKSDIECGLCNRAKVSILHSDKAQGESRRVLDAWTRIIQNKPRGLRWKDEEIVHRALFQDAHAHYKKAYAEQQSLLKSGEFNRRVAAAMALLPRGRDLYIADNVYAHEREEHWDIPVRPGVNLRDAYFQPMAVGITGRQAWCRTKIELAQSNLYPTAIHLPIALHQAGVALSHLNIELGGLQNDDVFACDLDTLQAFRSAVQSVEVVCFLGCPVINLRSRQSLSHLSSYLSYLLSNPNLTQASVDVCGFKTYSMDNMPGDIETRVMFPGSCLTHTPGLQRKCLNIVKLYRAKFRCAELLDFISSLPSRIKIFRLYEVKLLDGTWEEILDRLRKKRFDHEWSVKLCDLQGGEWDRDHDWEEEVELEGIFCDSDGTGELNYMEQYCMRFKKRNPLRLYRERNFDFAEYYREGPSGDPDPFE